MSLSYDICNTKLIEDFNNILEQDVSLNEICLIQDNDKSLKSETELFQQFDLKKKKKKSKKEKNKGSEDNISNDYDPPTYSYEFLINRIYTIFEYKDINLKQKKIIKMPLIKRLSSKKTAWINFNDCCISLDRNINEVQNFMMNELTTETNIDGNGYLVLKGIYIQKNIEVILRKYVIQYVQCFSCKGLETIIRKDSATRLSFLECLLCKSTRTIEKVNTYKR